MAVICTNGSENPPSAREEAGEMEAQKPSHLGPKECERAQLVLLVSTAS